MSTPLIGVGGKPRSGKDTFADHLIDEHGWKRVNMSAPIDALLRHVNPIIEATIIRVPRPGILGRLGFTVPVVQTIHYVDYIEMVGFTEAKKHPKVRLYLQDLGQGARVVLDQMVWVDAAARTIDEQRAAGNAIILSGVRTPEEAQMIVARGGLTIWVEREHSDKVIGAGHAIENSISVDDFLNVVENDGTIADLHEKARKIGTSLWRTS